MALRWNWTDKMGTMTIKQTTMSDGKKVTKKHVINIYDGNCLAIFINEYKNDNGEDYYNMYSFFLDKSHAERIAKNHDGKLMWDDVVSIKLNLAYEKANKLFKLFLKYGYEVTCYHKAF